MTEPKNNGVTVLPDGSAFAVLSLPLPKNHWSTQPGDNEPPAPFRMGADDIERPQWVAAVKAAARYAVRASTMNGAVGDFDPDAMVQNMVIGLLGYYTPDGTSGTGSLSFTPPTTDSEPKP